MDTNVKEQHGSFRALFRTIRGLHLPWLWIIFGLSLNLIANDLMLDLPDTTANLLSGQLSASALMEAVGFYVALGLISVAAVAAQAQAQTYSARRARESLWKKMLSLKMDYHDRNDPSDMMSAITNDVSAAATDLANIILYLIPDIYYVVMAMIRINEYHWILSLSCFALLPLKFLYAWFMGRKLEASYALIYGKIGQLTGFLADRISHLPLIKTYTNEEAETESGKTAANALLKANMKLVHLGNIASGIVSALDVLQKFIVVVVAVVLLQQSKIDIAMWLAFFLFSQNLFPYVDQVIDCWTRIKGMQGTFQRVVDLMDGESEDAADGKAFPATGDIRFENVTFAYPETDAPALKEVSFTLSRGSSLAIVGLCGSGKTTTISMLERFYTPDSGEIFIGDTNIRDISLADFRSHLAYVQQGAGVFSGTLREALTYGIPRTVSDDELTAAAERTGFSEYLALCEKGLDTPIASDGSSMSGGQSQRLVLTRELLRGGDIILMDEPTSALDVQVSAKIQAEMDALFTDKTRILITHDLDFARHYDRILVLRGGRLVGDGSHEELLRTCEAYRQMYENREEEAAV